MISLNDNWKPKWLHLVIKYETNGNWLEVPPLHNPHNHHPRPDLYILERLLPTLIVALQRSPRLEWPASGAIPTQPTIPTNPQYQPTHNTNPHNTNQPTQYQPTHHTNPLNTNQPTIPTHTIPTNPQYQPTPKEFLQYRNTQYLPLWRRTCTLCSTDCSTPVKCNTNSYFQCNAYSHISYCTCMCTRNSTIQNTLTLTKPYFNLQFKAVSHCQCVL